MWCQQKQSLTDGRTNRRMYNRQSDPYMYVVLWFDGHTWKQVEMFRGISGSDFKKFSKKLITFLVMKICRSNYWNTFIENISNIYQSEPY